MEPCNHVGKLQEICSKQKSVMPIYNEMDCCNDKSFRFSCTIGELSTEGTGINKKSAKQKSAEQMIEKIEKGEVSFPLKKISTTSVEVNAVSLLYQYCMKEKKTKPLFSEKGGEQDSVSIECTYEGFVGLGKGLSKKEAKEQAAQEVVNHFGIDGYFEKLKNRESRFNSSKTPVTLLHELCQLRKSKVIFKEDVIFLSENKRVFEVTCTVGENQAKSSQKLSKKEAKNEAAVLMINILENHTPLPSPKETPSHSEPIEETTPLAASQSPDKQTPSEKDEENKSPKTTSDKTTSSIGKRSNSSEPVNGNMSPAKKLKVE